MGGIIDKMNITREVKLFLYLQFRIEETDRKEIINQYRANYLRHSQYGINENIFINFVQSIFIWVNIF